VTVAAYPNQPFNGRVLKIEPQAEEETTVTMFAVLVKIDNESGLLRPGMNAEVTVNVAAEYDVPAVPTIALRTMRDIQAAETYLGMLEGSISEALKNAPEPDENSATGDDGYRFSAQYWLVVEREGQLIPKWVRTGITDLDYSEIISGVSEADTIVLLPSSGFINTQERFRRMMNNFGGVPGMKGDKDKDKKK